MRLFPVQVDALGAQFGISEPWLFDADDRIAGLDKNQLLIGFEAHQFVGIGQIPLGCRAGFRGCGG